MKRIILSAILLVFLSIFYLMSQEDENVIQIAILLDTSNSMDGLIDQAKSQLWKIVNELALSKKNGKSPKIEVALFEYGNNSLSDKEGYIRIVSPLTTDLDLISDELFKLKTNGGNEYCGWVIKDAVEKLKWSKSNNVLKLIFIAGNEPFDQGSVKYEISCKDAISKGIIVNTIFCGSYQEGIQTFWKKGADIADGSYVNINQEQKYEYVETPYDKEIENLNQELNKTYIAYGSKGEEKKIMQERQDSNAMSMNKESVIQRSVTKSYSQYSNVEWDLVDAVKGKAVDLDKIDEKDLPKEMKKMSKEERKKYVENMIKKREEIQNKILKLNEQRNKYLADKRKEKSDKSTLDSAIIKIIKDQAKKKNYQF